MQETIIALMNEYGYLGILLLIMIENVFPPIPSEIILGFGGYMAGTTRLTILGVIFVSTIGSCLGAIILYYLGMIISKERFIKFTKSRLGMILSISMEDIEKANHWFLERGYKAILFGRFVPVIRSIISIPAGISRMPLLKFIFLTFIGTFIWNGFLTIMGTILGNNWYKIGSFIRKYSLFVIITIVFLIIAFFFWWFKKVKNKR